MTQLFDNNAASTLLNTINSTVTTLSVAAGEGALFPAITGSDFFLATLIGLDGSGQEDEWEIVKVTARTGDVFTVVRDQEGTTNTGWAATTRIQLRMTAGSIEKIQTDMDELESFAWWLGTV